MNILDEQNGILSYNKASRLQHLKMQQKGSTAKTGFPQIDRYVQGFLPGSITVLGAETSVGKTTLVANFAANIARDQNKRVVFFSLESGLTVTDLIASYVHKKDAAELTSHERVADRIDNLEIVAPLEQITLPDIERIIIEQTPDVVIIDHIHYLLHSTENVTNNVGDTVRKLQIIARKLNTHIIIVSHLRKPDNGKENEIPTIYKLKDSSALYQDPALVILLSRKRRNVEELQPGEDVFDSSGIVIVAKNRDFGTTGIARFTFNKTIHTFEFTEAIEQTEKQVDSHNVPIGDGFLPREEVYGSELYEQN